MKRTIVVEAGTTFHRLAELSETLRGTEPEVIIVPLDQYVDIAQAGEWAEELLSLRVNAQLGHGLEERIKQRLDKSRGELRPTHRRAASETPKPKVIDPTLSRQQRRLYERQQRKR